MKQLIRWFPMILIASGILAYANSFTAPFILDDARVITGNPNIHTLWPPWKAIYVPTRWVADLTFAVNLAIGGFTPADFRMTNILIHIAAGLFLFGVVRRTLRLARFKDHFDQQADWLALSIALLWIVHPLQTGCVTYIAQRIEALMGLFYLATFYCFIRGLSSPHPRRWTNAALALCAIGMGTKEVMATAPVLIFIFDGLLVSSSWKEAVRSRWKTHLALFMTIGIFAMLFLMGIGIARGQGVTLLGRMVSPWRYLLTQTEVIIHYLRLSFVPTSLCLNYNWPIAKGLAEVWPSAGVIVTLGLVTLAALLKRNAMAFPLVWMFVILAPTSSILPIPDAAFEHRMYLPLAGLVTWVVIGGHTWWQQRSARMNTRALVYAVSFIAVAGPALWFTALTYSRNIDYLSTETMWADIIEKRPDNPRGYIALSGSLINQGRDQAAIRLLNRALKRLPDYSTQTYEEIRQQWNADMYIPCVDYAVAHSLLGAAYLNSGNTNEAISNLREAMRVSPSRPVPYLNMGRIAMAQKKYQEATMWLKFSLMHDPENQDTLCILATLLALQQNWTSSINYFESALKLNPTHGFARAQLAWMLATCPDATVRNGPKAVERALPLIPMSEGKSARAFDILAAAFAETGAFDKAVKYAEEALRILSTNATLPPLTGHTSVTPIVTQGFSAEEITQRINLYKQKLPYREAP